MTTALYTAAVEGFMKARFQLLLDTIKVVLVDGGLYTPDVSSHQYLIDIPEAAEVGSAVALSGRTLVNGHFNADDTTFLSVPDTTAEYVVIYKERDSRATSELIAVYATTPVVNVDGDDVTVLWPPDGILVA